jgi:hypothetical protein
MLKQNKHILIIFIIIVLILIIYNVFYNYIKIENFDFFNCTMTLNNITPNFKNNYMQYDNQHVSCGPCKNATLNIIVNTVDVDEYGSPVKSLPQSGTIESSLGNPIVYKSDITPSNISNFFCIYP